MKKSYTETVFEGHYNTVRGYIEGFLAGIGRDVPFFFCSDWEVKAETFSELIRDWISLGNKIHNVIIDDELLSGLKAALKKSGEKGLLSASSIKSEKKIAGAFFEFKFVTYGRKYGEEIKALLKNLPDGAALKDYTPVEKIDKDAKGAELYAPAHEYMLEGSGTVEGPVEVIIPLRKALDDHPLIEAASISLKF